MNSHTPPWGLTRSRPFPAPAPASFGAVRVELDPVTQTGVYRDIAGQIIEAGAHGTNKETNDPTATSGGDGAKDGGGDTDAVTDYGDD
ncbi:putative ATP-grasp-modified RiPP [Streptosporangium sp. NPDC051023]|uniref:putative ATP-grasp-modified RiPP n=1 Tax=Streptosporangium sp. NPDC051023 TaxID=3155410 RepID=UPI00344E564D